MRYVVTTCSSALHPTPSSTYMQSYKQYNDTTVIHGALPGTSKTTPLLVVAVTGAPVYRITSSTSSYRYSYQ